MNKILPFRRDLLFLSRHRNHFAYPLDAPDGSNMLNKFVDCAQNVNHAFPPASAQIYSSRHANLLNRLLDDLEPIKHNPSTKPKINMDA